MTKSNPPKWETHPSREAKDPRDVVGSKDYVRLGKDSIGRDIYALKEFSGVYYAVTEYMRVAVRVKAVKPPIELPSQYKKPVKRHRHNRSAEKVPRSRKIKL